MYKVMEPVVLSVTGVVPVGFWSKVAPANDNGCLLWQAAANGDGYGLVRVGSKLQRAHRVAWEAVNGPIPNGLCVCHRCDQPGCINPQHLFLGEHRDNVRDCAAKGRLAAQRPGHTRGERNGNSKLTRLQVAQIRRKHSLGRSKSSLAREYAVAPTTIRRIVDRTRWR